MPAMARAADAVQKLDNIEPALRRLERLTFLLDEAIRVPGTKWRIGLDGIAGFIPGVGDSITGLIALYPVLEAWRLGAPAGLLARMLLNVGIDTAVGSVPVLGDLFDLTFKSNRRNIELLRRHLHRERGIAPKP